MAAIHFTWSGITPPRLATRTDPISTFRIKAEIPSRNLPNFFFSARM